MAGLGGTHTSGRRRAVAPAGARPPVALEHGATFDSSETAETLRLPSLAGRAGRRPGGAAPPGPPGPPGPVPASPGDEQRPGAASLDGRAGARARTRAARSAERGGPWFLREFLLTAALVGVLVAMGLIVVESRWRQGLSGLGVVLLALAVARLVLPVRFVGMVAVRGRLFDTVTMLALGLGVIGLMLEVPLPVAG